jgi:hypothetical protein
MPEISLELPSAPSHCATDFVTLTVTFSVFLTPFLPDLRSSGRSTVGKKKIFLPGFFTVAIGMLSQIFFKTLGR